MPFAHAESFSLVLETPQPNLVAGMKWFLGTYTGGYAATSCSAICSAETGQSKTLTQMAGWGKGWRGAKTQSAMFRGDLPSDESRDRRGRSNGDITGAKAEFVSKVWTDPSSLLSTAIDPTGQVDELQFLADELKLTRIRTSCVFTRSTCMCGSRQNFWEVCGTRISSRFLKRRGRRNIVSCAHCAGECESGIIQGRGRSHAASRAMPVFIRWFSVSEGAEWELQRAWRPASMGV